MSKVSYVASGGRSSRVFGENAGASQRGDRDASPSGYPQSTPRRGTRQGSDIDDFGFLGTDRPQRVIDIFVDINERQVAMPLALMCARGGDGNNPLRAGPLGPSNSPPHRTMGRVRFSG